MDKSEKIEHLREELIKADRRLLWLEESVREAQDRCLWLRKEISKQEPETDEGREGILVFLFCLVLIVAIHVWAWNAPKGALIRRVMTMGLAR